MGSDKVLRVVNCEATYHLLTYKIIQESQN